MRHNTKELVYGVGVERLPQQSIYSKLGFIYLYRGVERSGAGRRGTGNCLLTLEGGKNRKTL